MTASPEKKKTRSAVSEARDEQPARDRQGGRRPALRFIAGFIGWGVAFYFGLFFFMQSAAYQAFLALNARASALLISIFQSDLRVQDSIIATGAAAPRQFTVQVAEGCDPLQPIAIFAAAVLAMPVGWKRRIVGLLVGVAALLALNLVRIASLFLIGAADPDLFEIMHLDVWQAGFVLIAFLLWSVWAHFATRAPSSAGRTGDGPEA